MNKMGIYKQILREYDKKRTQESLELAERKRDIYEQLPRIKEIDEEIMTAGFSLGKISLNNPKNAKSAAAEYKAVCKALQKEREAILKEIGIPKRFLELHYDCGICKDTGFLNNRECKCFRQKLIDRIYGQYSLRERLKSDNFDNFDFRYYSDKTGDGQTVSPRKNMERLMRFCLKYAEGFGGNDKSILFYGKPGLGKTFLCNSIARELMGKGFTVMYLTAFQLFRFLEDMQFGRLGELERDNTIDDFLTADLLIIDDIGTEFSTVLTNSGFFNILNSRANWGRPVIISTNLYPSELKDLYSERSVSRIIGDYIMYEFYGEDIRQMKKFNVFAK